MPIDNSTRFPKPLAADLRELSEGMAIVIDGDTAPKAIASGQYLFIKNHSTLATGGYHATAAIAKDADITSSNVTPDADGIVNGAVSALSERISNKQNKLIQRAASGSPGSQVVEITVNSGEYLVGGHGMFFPVAFEYNPSTGKWYAHSTVSIAGGDVVSLFYYVYS